MILMNKATFDKLSAADKQAFLEAAEGGRQGEARARRRGRSQGRGRAARQGHEGGRQRRQGQVPGGARARSMPSSRRSSARTTSTRSATTSSALQARAVDPAGFLSRIFLRVRSGCMQPADSAHCAHGVACLMLVVAACLGMLPDHHPLRLRAAGRMVRGADPHQPDLDGLPGHPHGLPAGRDGERRRALPLGPAEGAGACSMACVPGRAGADRRDHLVRLGLRGGRGPDHGRAGDRLDGLGLPGHAGGRPSSACSASSANLLDPQRHELETAQ